MTPRPYRRFELQAISRLYAAGFDLDRLARILRRTPAGVARKAQRMAVRRP